MAVGYTGYSYASLMMAYRAGYKQGYADAMDEMREKESSSDESN